MMAAHGQRSPGDALELRLSQERSTLQELGETARRLEAERDELARSLHEASTERLLLQEELRTARQQADAAEAKAGEARHLLRAKEDELRALKRRRQSPGSAGLCSACSAPLKSASPPRPRSGILHVRAQEPSDTTDGEPDVSNGTRAGTAASGGANLERLLTQLCEAESMAAREALCARDAALCHSAEVERRCLQLREVFIQNLEGLARLRSQETLEAVQQLSERSADLGCMSVAPEPDTATWCQGPSQQAPGQETSSAVMALAAQLQAAEARLQEAATHLKRVLNPGSEAEDTCTPQDGKLVARIMEAQQEVTRLQCDRGRVEAALLAARVAEVRSMSAGSSKASCISGGGNEVQCLRALLAKTQQLCAESTMKLVCIAEENVKLSSTLSKVQGTLTSQASAASPGHDGLSLCPGEADAEQRCASGRQQASEARAAQRQQLLEQMTYAAQELDRFLADEVASPRAFQAPGAPEPWGVQPATTASQPDRLSPVLEPPAEPGLPGASLAKAFAPRNRVAMDPDGFPAPAERPWTTGFAMPAAQGPEAAAAPATARGARAPLGRRAANWQKLPALPLRTPQAAPESDRSLELGQASPTAPTEAFRHNQRELVHRGPSVSID